jgi:choline dehydrogenase
MTAGIWQMRPLSRGHVEARSPRPEEQPSINPRYMEDERDRRAVIGGMRIVRDWFREPALARYVVAETLPGPDVQTDDEFIAYARQTGTTVFHASCSCRMGPDPMSVVDDQLRVHGLGRLRVIDASVMPAVTSTNTNAPTIMSAEKGAALVRASRGSARVTMAAEG